MNDKTVREVLKTIYINKKLDDVQRKKVIDEALKIAEDSDDYRLIATVIEDKQLVRKVLEKALQLADETYEQIEVATLIAHENVLSDKAWAVSVIESIADTAYCREDFLNAAILLASSKTINDKKSAKSWFERAISDEECYGLDADYYKIASNIFNAEGLDDKKWAADLCIKGYKNVFDIEELVSTATLVYQTYQEEAKNIISYAIDLIENDEDYLTADLLLIASNISDEQISSLPFIHDKLWSKQVFDKAMQRAETKEEKDTVLLYVKQYLQ